MISTITTSLHSLAATLIFSAAALILLAGPRNIRNRAIGSILVLYSLASIAFGLGVNAYSIQQATPWLLLEMVATYSSAPAAILVSLIILRPKIARNLYVTVTLWGFILLPPVFILLDLTNLSQTMLSTHILLSLDNLNQMYSGGYVSVTTTGGNIFLFLELILFYLVWIFFPNLFVYIRDNKSDRQNALNALILTAVSVIGAAIITVFEASLPITLAPLLTNSVISIGFFIVGIRTIMAESHATSANSWLQIILKNYSMFTKLATTIGLIVIPAVVFITFSSFSFFQTSLLTVANKNLMVITHHGATSIIDQLNTEFHAIEHLNEASRPQVLLARRANEYQGQSKESIQQLISSKNDQWISNDMLLISTTLDPDNNNQLRFLVEDNPNYLNLTMTDSFGGLITATEKPSTYDFSQNSAWLFTSENDQLYLSQVTWDEEFQHYKINFASPLHNQDDELVGVILGDLIVTEIITSLQKFEQNTITFGLTDQEGKLIPSTGLESGEFYVPTFALNTSMDDQNWKTFQQEEEAFLVQSSPVVSQEFGFTAPWKITAFQPVSQALSSLRTATVTSVGTAGIIITISTLIIISLSQSISRPLSQLTDAAKKILEGETKVVLQMDSADELGTLASSFNQMSSELNTLLNTLEGTIEERTLDLEKRAVQLEASAVVARQAAEVKDVATLLDLVVNLIPEKFNYYHAGIFLLDEHKRFAVLQAANSEGGKRMLDRYHKLQVGRVGVVGYAAGMGQPRISQDVGADVVYYANPDMPATRSELALPLKVREKVIGVLDVQSTESNAFSQEDITVLQVLSDQLALAIDNARLLENSQAALEELQTIYGLDTARAWRQRLSGKDISFAYDSTGLTKKLSQPVKVEEDSQALLSKPISLRGNIIGNLNFIREGKEKSWSEDETQLIEEILEQTALALENARLVNQIRLRSDQIQLLQEITALAASVLNENELLESVAKKLHKSLKVQHCGIALLDEQQRIAELVTSVTDMDAQISLGSRLVVEEDRVTQLVIQSPQTITLAEIESEPTYQAFKQAFTTQTNASLTFIPLAIRDQAVGYIFLENQDQNRQIEAEEENLFSQIGTQISAAIESARLFAAEQEGRIAAAALLEITQIASASLDMNQVLNQATNRSAQAIQAHRCTIFLLDEKEKIKPLISIYADGSEMPEEEWELLKRRVRETYEHFPLHRLAANLRAPKIISKPLTYPNLPLYWTEDFEIENLLMVPLISQNKVIGSMVFDQINPNLTFKQNQAELAQTIAGQIATTIENANLFQEAVLRAERERQVTEITAKIRSSNDPQKIMETAITELRMALAQTTGKTKRNVPKSIPSPKPTPPSIGNNNDTQN